MDDQKKDHPDPISLPKRKHPKQLETYEMATYDVENNNITNSGGTC